MKKIAITIGSLAIALSIATPALAAFPADFAVTNSTLVAARMRQPAVTASSMKARRGVRHVTRSISKQTQKSQTVALQRVRSGPRVSARTIRQNALDMYVMKRSGK